MSRLREDRGFTLPELLTTMAMAMIVSLATFTLIEIVMKRSGDVGSRVETTAKARTAMDQITRQLRSQVCAKTKIGDTARSLVAAAPTSLTLYTDFTGEPLSNGLLPAPDLRTVAYGGGAINETITKGTRASNNTVSYSTTPAPKPRALLTQVVPADFTKNDAGKPAGSAVLPPNSTANQEISGDNADGSLTDAQLATVAMISVKFKVLAKTGGDGAATTLQNQVYVRTADPNAQIPKPTCQTY